MDRNTLLETAWRRGWQDTKRGWANWRFLLLEAVIAPILGFTLNPWISLTAVAVGMFIIWIGATSTAPLRQRNEARDEIKRLTGVLHNAQVNQNSVDELGKFFADGDVLFQRRVQNDLEYSRWAAEANAWLNIVIDTLTTSFTMADVQLFQHITSDRVAGEFEHAFSSKHNGQLGALKSHLANLRSIINRYAVSS